jgi:hypothetical protein
MVQVSQCAFKHWNEDIDEFVRYFTKNYVYIYDEYKDLIPYSICTLKYTNGKKNNRPYHHDPPAYVAIVGFNFEGTAKYKLEQYTDYYQNNHDEQLHAINDDDCYVMLGHDTCRNRKHAVDGCSEQRFVPLIKYVDKTEYLENIKASKAFRHKSVSDKKWIAVEQAVSRLLEKIVKT